MDSPTTGSTPKMPTADHLPATITSTSPCIIQVIDTAELLENVLLYLDPRTLLFAKRVSQHFRDTMEGSIKIQKALFFQPMVHPTAAEIEIVEKHNTSAFEPWDEDNCPAGTLAIATANPFLSRYVNYDRGGFLEISVTHVRKDLSKLIRSPINASWRRMYVIQPRALPIWKTKYCEVENAILCKMASGHQGLKMGDLVDLDLQNCALAARSASKYYRPRLNRTYVELFGSVKVVLGKYDATDRICGLRKCRFNFCAWDLLLCDFRTQLERYEGEYGR